MKTPIQIQGDINDLWAKREAITKKASDRLLDEKYKKKLLRDAKKIDSKLDILRTIKGYVETGVSEDFILKEIDRLELLIESKMSQFEQWYLYNSDDTKK